MDICLWVILPHLPPKKKLPRLGIEPGTSGLRVKDPNLSATEAWLLVWEILECIYQ